jgi:preprotein translocase subunit Sss1
VLYLAFSKKEDAIKYVNEYQKEKYDRITVMAKKGKKEEWTKAAQFKNMKLSAFVQDCVEKELERMRK